MVFSGALVMKKAKPLGSDQKTLPEVQESNIKCPPYP